LERSETVGAVGRDCAILIQDQPDLETFSACDPMPGLRGDESPGGAKSKRKLADDNK